MKLKTLEEYIKIMREQGLTGDSDVTFFSGDTNEYGFKLSRPTLQIRSPETVHSLGMATLWLTHNDQRSYKVNAITELFEAPSVAIKPRENGL